MTNNISATGQIAQATLSVNSNSGAKSSDLGSWYEAMAKAWGDALNEQANTVTTMSEQIGTGGQDDPKTMTLLTAESLRMQFLSNNASTATTSVGQALEALARK